MATLTKKQKQILDFIESHIKKRGLSPTINEIRKRFKLSALSTVHQHIKALEKKGFIEKNGSSARGLELKEKKQNDLMEIPLIGTITAGKPIEAIENESENVIIKTNDSNKNNEYYALRVRGNSMIDEGIFNEDIVIIKKQAVAENGQTVVAIIDDNQATLKKIYREKDRFRLQPANQAMLPFYRREVEIRGVVYEIKRSFENNKSVKINNLRTLDLFAGVGGIRLGFEKAGFETVFANDFDEQCKSTYDLNFPTSKLVVEDIKKVGVEDLPEFDFLLAGFPCQAFSIAGYRKGFEDDKGRGNLFFDIVRILKARKPKGFLLENVKNLKGHDRGRTFSIIKKTLENLGYHVKQKVLNTMEYGNIPQNRERIYIIGFKNKTYNDNFEFPKTKELKTKVSDLLEKKVPEKYYYNGKPLYTRLKNEVKNKNTVYQWRRQYVRENKKGVCPTLTANMGMGGHNVPIIRDSRGIRKLTPLECFRIQGFPADFNLPTNLSDSALYKQAGNSVSVPVIKAIACQIKKAISQN